METVTLESLQLSDNSKVRFERKHYNTFSLASGPPEKGGTCPGATCGEGGCTRVCYDENLKKLYKNYKLVEDKNTELLQGKSLKELVNIIDNTVQKWLLAGGHKKPYFRLHTGGDFYNATYAAAWAEVIKQRTEIHFWVYTRSLFAVPILADLDNITIYLSTDPVNKDKVLSVYTEYADYDNVALAWMGNTIPDDFPKDRTVLVCPEVSGKMKKMKDIGACSRCRACIDRPLKTGKVRHIQFPIHR